MNVQTNKFKCKVFFTFFVPDPIPQGYPAFYEKHDKLKKRVERFVDDNSVYTFKAFYIYIASCSYRYLQREKWKSICKYVRINFYLTGVDAFDNEFFLMLVFE